MFVNHPVVVKIKTKTLIFMVDQM